MRSSRCEARPAAARTEISPGVWLDSRLALWLEAPRLLVIADLHWGYSASHRARGNLVPVWGDDDIESRLAGLLSDYVPAEMLWLGDVVHAAEGSTRAEAFLRQASTPVTLIAGNHDRRWKWAQDRSTTRDQFFFHHGDGAPAVAEGRIEVIGHHHPAFDWYDGAGSRLKIPALVSSKRRLILPAFSPWAAGTGWYTHLQPNETLWAIAPNRIFAVPPRLAANS
jgi:metallophosphoesterase superfamily enzyme